MLYNTQLLNDKHGMTDCLETEGEIKGERKCALGDLPWKDPQRRREKHGTGKRVLERRKTKDTRERECVCE